MWLKLDIDGIELNLRISGYKPIADWKSEYSWCQVDLQLKSSWLDYKINGELLDMGEVVLLQNRMSDLLSDKTTDITAFEGLEPDIQFQFFPRRDIRNDPKVLYVAPGHQFFDISADMIITFWNEGLTNNRLILNLGCDEIEYFRDYLLYVEKTTDFDKAKLDKLIAKGVFFKETRQA
ncbi:MAG: hypothetical protein CVV04_03545 [Firmicutes bacterium HGW-Firmicutes-9]|jgi:hypothetical protein|nr:MAG: hypothetical protein CVV04_03545 [Firmicutes bacterium HGW-Firmicutes-9]